MFRTSKRYLSSLTFQKSKEDRIKAFGADFHHVWLRDNCQCSACVHPTNKQKLHSSAQFSSTIKPLHVQLSSNDLRVVWPDGHKSRFSAENPGAAHVAPKELKETFKDKSRIKILFLHLFK